MILYKKYSLLSKLSIALILSILTIEGIIFVPSYKIKKQELAVQAEQKIISQSQYTKELKAYTFRIEGLVVIIVIFVVTVLIIILNFLVLRPIRKIVKANEDNALIEPSEFPNDEFGSIMLSRSQMLNTLKAHQEKLEDMVAQRTAQLKEAYKKLSVIDQAKGDFLTLISHELRTPLTILKQSIDLLDPKTGDTKFLNMTKKQVGRFERLVEFSEDIVKLNLDQIVLEKNMVGLNQIIDDVSKTFQKKALEKHINIQCESCNEPVEVYGNAQKIRQILEHLMDNAIKFSPPDRTVKIILATKGTDALITIEDQGPGIEEENKEKILEPFGVQTDLLHHHKGLGLSLFWSKKIIELMNGSLHLESEMGKGTKFTIRLPKAIDSLP